jgi:hypothetical protein
MSKFLNKKQTVFDLKLTSYGKYLLANGRFKPTFYTFLDDNVIYDPTYMGETVKEHQNEIHHRIKNETQYLEGLVDFTSINSKTTEYKPHRSPYEFKLEDEVITPKKENKYYEKIIGDAHHSADAQLAPAMKIVSLIGDISSSFDKDLKNNFEIPQINIESIYRLKVTPYEPYYDSEEEQKLKKLISSTRNFADNNVISLEASDVMIYAEELNTDVLNENFEIEIFEVLENRIPPPSRWESATDLFKRKYFKKDFGKIQGGYMSPDETNVTNKFYVDEHTKRQITNQAVANYFDVLVDYEINKNDACKAASVFNKESYYVDIDFDCSTHLNEEIKNYDIYGVVTEPEICD